MAKSSLQINEFLIVTRYFFFYQRFYFQFVYSYSFLHINLFFPSSVPPTLRLRFFFHIKSRKFFTLKRVDSQILMFDLVSHLSCGLILNFIFYHFDVTLTQIETIHSVKQPDFGPLISQTASFRKVINQAQKWFKLNRNWRFAFDVSSLFYQMIDSFFFTTESNQIDTHSTFDSNISILRVSTLTPFISNFTSFVWDRR